MTGKTNGAYVPRAINPREAYTLLHAQGLVDVPENKAIRLTREVVAEILGDHWEARLDSDFSQDGRTSFMRDILEKRSHLILATSYPPGSEKYYVYLDKERLQSVAAAAVEPGEALGMLEKRLRGREGIDRFVRMHNDGRNAPDIFCSQSFMENQLGGAWRERLKRSSMSFEEKAGDVYIPFSQLQAVATPAMRRKEHERR